jgi:hypothetical protein
MYQLDTPVAAADLATAKDKLRREELPDGVDTPQERGRRREHTYGSWIPRSVDDYMSALTDLAPDVPIYDSDYGVTLICRDMPLMEGPEQTYKFTLSYGDDRPLYVAQVKAMSLYAAIDQILDSMVEFSTADGQALHSREFEHENALFAMLTSAQTSYEEMEISGESVAWELVPNA